MIRIPANKLALICIAISLLLSATTYADVNDSGIKVKWSYKGNTSPERWGQLDPSFRICASGKSQSPINIKSNGITVPNTLVFHYQPAPLVIIDDGNTELMLGNTQTIINDGHGVQVNFRSAKETITFEGKDYKLIQFHIHSPSENRWNDRSFPLEIHFVHQGENGQLAVIGVFVKGGKLDKTLDKIIKNLPEESGKEMTIKGENINPINLIPAKHSYYSFAGSLTTPPCIEGVQWIMISDPISASPAQIAKLREAVGGGNARPVQSLHDRKISFAKIE